MDSYFVLLVQDCLPMAICEDGNYLLSQSFKTKIVHIFAAMIRFSMKDIKLGTYTHVRYSRHYHAFARILCVVTLDEVKKTLVYSRNL